MVDPAVESSFLPSSASVSDSAPGPAVAIPPVAAPSVSAPSVSDPPRRQQPQTRQTAPDRPPRVSMLGFEIDPVSMEQSVQLLLHWLDCDTADPPTRLVVTPNVDHAVMLQTHAGLQAVYRDADLIVADGFPLIVASKILGHPLPERVAGSELVPAFCAALTRPTTIYLLGAMPGVAARAARKMESAWPLIDVVGTHSPEFGFEKSESACESILSDIHRKRPDILMVGLGAPKQELWTHRFRDRLETKITLCIGATIDFLAGEKRQAPVWMRRSGLEWLHRLSSEPKRLASRYAKDAWVFPQLIWQDWTRR